MVFYDNKSPGIIKTTIRFSELSKGTYVLSKGTYVCVLIENRRVYHRLNLKNV